MTIIEALTLAKEGKKVRPVCWRDNRPGLYLVYYEIPGEESIFRARILGAFAITPLLETESVLLGEWEVVE